MEPTSPGGAGTHIADTGNTAPADLRPDKPSLRRGSVWALTGYAGSQAIRLGGNLILWRLLYPKAFGIMALVNVLMVGLHMFSDVGIGPSIIQNKQGANPTYLNTAWTIQAIRGLMLFLAATAAAVPVARFYGEPILAWMIPVVGFGSVISGMNSTKLFTAVRQIALGRLTILDLIAQTAGLVLMVVVAFARRSIWGLVFGGLASDAVRLALGHIMLPGIRNRLVWDRPSARTLLRFGRWIFLSTLLTFVVGQSDRLIFGKLIPIELLGVYSIATVWCGLPIAILDRVFSLVLFPALSRLDHTGQAFVKAFRDARTSGLIVAGWMTASLLSGAPALIRLLYDQRAVDAGWIVQSLAIGTWLLALETTNRTALLSQGRANWAAVGSAAKLVGMLLAIPIGFAIGGFRGAVLGFSASELLRYCASVVGARTINLRGYRQDLMLSAAVAASAAFGVGAAKGAGRLLAPLALQHVRLEAFLEGVAVFVVVSVAWGGIYLVHKDRPNVPPGAPRS